MFELTHPGSTGRRGRGYHNLGIDKPGDADDGEYRLCAQCGFPCRLDRDAHGDSIESPGLEQATTTVTLTIPEGGTTDIVEMNVKAGCPFCGSLNYEGNNRMRNTPARNPRTRR